MSPDVVASIRRFNRAYTQRIGVLDESFLGSGRPLGSARLLFEIGVQGAGVHELRDRLGLDSGYLSRLLRGLEADGMVAVQPDPADRRRRIATLTTAGKGEWQQLDERSDLLAQQLVAPLTPAQRARLTDALETADRLIRAATVTFDVTDPAAATVVASLTRYFAELNERFDEGFDPGDTITVDADSYRAPHGAFVVASSDGRAVGCGAITRIDARTGEIKRMWVDPTWRGLGIGRRLLTALEQLAAEAGHGRVVLDTNSALVEAIAMYEGAGYHGIERYNDNPYARRWFEKTLPPTRR